MQQFPPCRARYDGLQSYCRDCYRALHRAYHRRNGDRRRAHVRRISAAARDRNRARILEYLRAHPCVDCGITDVRVLEFHHLSDKTMDISELVTRGYSWERTEAEITRCVVLCANCHRIRELERRGSFRASSRRPGQVGESRGWYLPGSVVAWEPSECGVTAGPTDLAQRGATAIAFGRAEP